MACWTDIKTSVLSEQDAGKPAAAALQSYSSMQKHSPMANVSTGPGKDVAFNTSSAITLKTLQLPESAEDEAGHEEAPICVLRSKGLY